MNPQQPIQDSSVLPSGVQPVTAGEQVTETRQISQPPVGQVSAANTVPQAAAPQPMPVQVPFVPSPIPTPTPSPIPTPTPSLAVPVASSPPIPVQPVAPQPMPAAPDQSYNAPVPRLETREETEPSSNQLAVNNLSPQQIVDPQPLVMSPVGQPEPEASIIQKPPLAEKSFSERIVDVAPVYATPESVDYSTQVTQNTPFPPPTPLEFSGSNYSASQEVVFESNRKRKIANLVISVCVLLAIGASIFGFVTWKNNRLRLETFSGDGYTILVPSGYKESEQFPFTGFAEDDDEATQSAVMVMMQKYEKVMTRDEFSKLTVAANEATIRQSMSATGAGNITYGNVRIESDLKEGHNTYTGFADTIKDSEIIGKLYFKYSFSTTGATAVIVAAHQSDPQVSKNAQKIIDSLATE